MTRTELISVIIANYNGSEYLHGCLRSVTHTAYRNLEIVIIDDGSTDNSVPVIKKWQKKDKRIKLITNKNNLGAAASRNLAVRLAKGKILVFLDNDTQVQKDWLKYLLINFMEDVSCGASQALIVDFVKRNTIQMAGGLLQPDTGWLIPYGQHQLVRQAKLSAQNIVGISAGLAVRKSAFEKVNGFDAQEAVFTEDLDFCWRLWLSGYKVLLAPQAIVYHYSKNVSQREKMGVSFTNVYFHLAKNSFRSMIKNYETQNIFRYLPASLLINFGRGIVFLFLRQKADALKGSLAAVIWNLYNLPDLLKARAATQNVRKLTDKQLFMQIFDRRPLVVLYKKYYL